MILYRCCKEKFCLDQSQELKGWAVYFDLSFVLFHCRFYLSFSKNGSMCWRWFNQFWSCDFPNSIRKFCWQWMGFFSWDCQEGRSKKGRLNFATDQWTSFTPVSLKYHICILFFRWRYWLTVVLFHFIQKQNPEDRANFLSRLTFWWFNWWEFLYEVLLFMWSNYLECAIIQSWKDYCSPPWLRFLQEIIKDLIHIGRYL